MIPCLKDAKNLKKKKKTPMKETSTIATRDDPMLE